MKYAGWLFALIQHIMRAELDKTGSWTHKFRVNSTENCSWSQNDEL